MSEQSADLVAEYEPLNFGEPCLWNGKYWATDDWLAWARERPSTLAAWVLRDVIDELIARREAMRTDG